jgi:hypothetical protein
MATILKFPEFDAAVQRASREALDLAVKEVGDAGQRHDVRQRIALRILRGARLGVSEIRALRDIGLSRRRPF